jgi:hypothetical protein
VLPFDSGFCLISLVNLIGQLRELSFQYRLCRSIVFNTNKYHGNYNPSIKLVIYLRNVIMATEIELEDSIVL